MPFTKFTPFREQEICKDKQHNPPSMIVLEPGIHEWTCPSCGKVTVIKVPKITY